MKSIGTPFFYVENRNVRRDGIADAIEKAAKKTRRVTIDAKATRDGKAIKVTAKLASSDAMPASARMFLVLVQHKSITDCKAGENKGRQLTEYYAVVAASEQVVFGKELVHTFRSGAKGLSVIVLVEDRNKMQTIDCARIPVP